MIEFIEIIITVYLIRIGSKERNAKNLNDESKNDDLK